MATIGRLSVLVTANTKRFRQGIAVAGKRMQRFTAAVKRSALSVSKWAAGLTVAATAATAYFVRRQFQAIDATAKLAKRIGITTEALTGLRLAAELTGAGTEAMDKGLGFLAKSLGEAKQGLGEGKQALAALGLSADDLLKMPLDKAFSRIADSIRKMATQSEKAFAATKLFGRGGLSLLNTLQQGSKELERIRKQNEALGGSFSAFDALKIENANDAVTRLGRAVRGLFIQIAIKVAPTVERVANRLTAIFVMLRRVATPIIGRLITRLKSLVVKVKEFALRTAFGIEFVFQNLDTAIAHIVLAMRKALVSLVHNFQPILKLFGGGDIVKGLEARLKADAGRLGQSFGDSLSQHIEKRLKHMKGGIDLLSKALFGIDIFAEADLKKLFGLTLFEKMAKGKGAPGAAAATGAPAGRPGALLKGSVEAFSAALRGSQEKETVKQLKKGNNQRRVLADILQRIADGQATPASI